MRRSRWTRPGTGEAIDVLVASRDVTAVFQPLVAIRSGEIVGYEALARPPAGSPFPDIGAVFREAYRRDLVGELDWVCRAAVFRAALEKKVPAELPLFVNVEPAALSAPCPVDIIGLFAAATNQCRFVVEVTERSLADDPAELLAAVERTRDVSIGVALDDVGARPASLALLPLVAPDVIKLDLSLIQSRPNPEIARIVNAVLAEAERTGAVIVAEGVESPRHLATAQSMGATLAQGWMFGAPAPLPDQLARPQQPLEPFSPPNPIRDTPFVEAARRRLPVPATRRHLAATSRFLENEILHSSGKSVLLSGFQTIDHFGPKMRDRYERLARATVLTAALGADMPDRPARGVRGVDLHPDDPLRREWTVVVLGSQVSAGLIARQVGEGVGAGRADFEAVITHDRELVVAAARSLMQRVPPLADPAAYADR